MKKTSILLACIVLILVISVWAGPATISSLSNGFIVEPEPYAQPGVNPFVGKWVNTDPNTEGITKIAIGMADNEMKVQVWGACSPEDCYWGEVDAHVPWCETERIQCTWILPIVNDFQEIIYIPDGDYLIMRVKSFYTYDQSGRIETYTYYFKRGDFDLPQY